MSDLENAVQLIHFQPDEGWQHVIIAEQDLCKNCQGKPCLTICPSGVFAWNNCDSDPVLVFYKQCVECGACRLICPYENIAFAFPHGGYGVAYRQG